MEYKVNKTLLLRYPETSISKVVADVFNTFEVDDATKELKSMGSWRDKARWINSGNCAEFAFRVLKAIEKKSKRNKDMHEWLSNAYVVVLQHVHCFLIINNTIYDAECPYGVPITNRTILDKFVAKWIFNLDLVDRYIAQYRVIELSNGKRALDKTGYEVFRVREDVTQEEQEEVWIPAETFMEVYESGSGEFSDCAYWPNEEE